MIAADTGTWIAYLQGDSGEDVELLDHALAHGHLWMCPPVLTELLSDPKLPAHVATALTELPLLPLRDGYWQRAGELRAGVLRARGKARLGDALIAQACLDASIPLITRDKDFRAMASFAALQLP